jgi:hypothetical protein
MKILNILSNYIQFQLGYLPEKLYLCKFEQKAKEILGIYFIYGQEIQRVQEVRSFKVG